MAMIILLLAQEHILWHKVQCGDKRQTAAAVVEPFNDQLNSKPGVAGEQGTLEEFEEPEISNVNTTRKLPESVTGRLNHHVYSGEQLWRVKRFAYEDTHEWPKTDSLDYDFDEAGETEELALWQKIGRNWQSVLIRGMFLMAGGIMLLMIICCCCNICCRVCCHSLRENCVPCGGFLAFITACYEDPMYKKAKNLASLMGLKLDYATYMQIKDRFETQGTGTYNPLGLPHMQ